MEVIWRYTKGITACLLYACAIPFTLAAVVSAKISDGFIELGEAVTDTI